MTNENSPNRPRNRRFLVSIWQKNARPGAPANPGEREDGLHGLVWEADPHDPGRIMTPESFVALSALPRIFSDFLYSGGKQPASAPPDQKSEEGG
jgi:hypothetical protein